MTFSVLLTLSSLHVKASIISSSLSTTPPFISQHSNRLPPSPLFFILSSSSPANNFVSPHSTAQRFFGGRAPPSPSSSQHHHHHHSTSSPLSLSFSSSPYLPRLLPFSSSLNSLSTLHSGEEPLPPPNTPGRPTTPPLPVLIPMVEEGKLDVVSRLLKDRILLLGNQVTDEVANVLVAQLLFLANSDPSKDIKLYINSPGGSVNAGLAVFDTIKYIPCDVETVCFGMAASMGAFLLSAGTKGKRRALPNARIMIHQPLGGAQGQAADIEIQAKEILFTRQLLNTYMAHFTGQKVDKIEKDSDRDFFMTPQEAKDYGLIDQVLQTKVSHVKIPPMPTVI